MNAHFSKPTIFCTGEKYTLGLHRKQQLDPYILKATPNNMAG